MRKPSNTPKQPLILCALLLGACAATESPPPPSGEQPEAPAFEQPAAPAPTPVPGCQSCMEPEPKLPEAPEPPPVDPPETGLLSLSRTQISLLGRLQTNWAVNVKLDGVAAPASTAVGECVRVPTPAAAATLDAGQLTVTGGVYQPLLIALDREVGEYLMVEDELDATDGSLFTESSQLQVSAAGGESVRKLTQQGPWAGVKPLQYTGPQTLDVLPASGLRLTWVAAPRSDVRMEVSLRSREFRIDCPVPKDEGSYTVPKAALDAVAGGPVYVFVSRVASALARTEPDRGLVRLESRSSWQIVTHK